MGSRQSASPFWTVVTILLIAALGFVGLLVLGRALNVGPLAPPAISSRATVLDYGRFTVPVPELHIDEPAGALILYVDTSGLTSTAEYLEILASLDEVAGLTMEPGDLWVYYYDTLSDDTLYSAARHPASDIGKPAAERTWTFAQFPSGMIPYRILYEFGFVSSR